MESNKILNNTCVEVLPALLNKSKIRTSRKAFTEHKTRKATAKDCGECNEFPCSTVPLPCNIEIEKENKEKPAKFKVGDEVDLIWNKNSDYEFMCICNPLNKDGLMNNCIQEERNNNPKHKIFHKNLGQVEILSIEKIIIGKETSNFEDENVTYYYIEESETGEMKNQKEYAKEEGFESPEEMFAYFEKHADLDTPKEFWTYKFEWI